MTIHEFTPPPVGATLHAVDGAARYLRVDWIMRQELGGAPTYYCATDDWPTTPAGQLAAKDAEIAALHAHIRQLETRLAAAASVPPTVAAAATGMEPSDLICVDCGRNFKNTHALTVHRGRAHSARPAAPAPRAPIALIDDRDDWLCQFCLSGAHARDLHQPNYCIKCAAKSSALNRNEVAA